jgi:hypothetical protein
MPLAKRSAAFVALAVSALDGCGGASLDATAPPVDAGAPEASAKPKPQPTVEEPPAPLADGWLPYTDYPDCQLATPPPDKPLPPLTWEPCGPLAGDLQQGCRMIHIDWNAPRKWGGNKRISDYTDGLRHDDGTIALMTSREVGGDVVHMIVDADGPVRQAIRERNECIVMESQSSGDHYVYTVWFPHKPENSGALGGRLGERPRVLVTPSDGISHSYAAGAAGVVESPGMNLHAWADGAPIAKLRPPDDAGLFTGEFNFIGDTVLWNAGDLLLSRQNVWSPSGGVRALLTAGDDPAQGYADLGTDGVQMVWSQGVRTDVNYVYPRLSIVTSPYATSSADLKPRVLRSDITGHGLGLSQWLTGCGYAIRYSFLEPFPGTFRNIIDIVRLSDGRAWILPDDPGRVFGWRRPLGVTCDEVFGFVQITPNGPGSSYFNVARIRLDSLGPGTPPP